MSSEFQASLRRIKPEKRNKPLQRRPDSALDFIETITGRPAKLLYDTTVYIDILQDHFPKEGELMLRAVDAWHSPITEAELAAACGLLDPDHSQTRKVIAEIAALIDRRLQGYEKGQRRRILNDALLFVSARRSGCTVLTRSVSDFDFLQQLDPTGRVLFYRI